jgi:hypothetical protein
MAVKPWWARKRFLVVAILVIYASFELYVAWEHRERGQRYQQELENVAAWMFDGLLAEEENSQPETQNEENN